tara:strand:+ start:1084 stop:1359 length:276 start_codon:yes stop_codon:yes gene_type:complete
MSLLFKAEQSEKGCLFVVCPGDEYPCECGDDVSKHRDYKFAVDRESEFQRDYPDHWARKCLQEVKLLEELADYRHIHPMAMPEQGRRLDDL